MNTNIVELITSQLGGGALGKLSSLLGESSDRTQTAVGAAVPTLLAGLSHTASTPDGARRLSAMTEQADSGIAGNFASMLSTQGTSIQDKGSNALSSLFGGGMLSSIASGLGRFTGLKGGSITSLLGMLAPLIFGVLGKHQRSAGLDAAGLGNFLAGQKQNISAAMPPGLSSVLSGIPGLSGFTQKTAAEPAYSDSYSREPAYGKATTAYAHEERASSAGKWLPALLAVGALAGLLWGWKHHRSAERVAKQEVVVREPAGSYREPAVTIREPAGSLKTDTTGLTTKLSDTFTSATTSLGNITDATSAENAMPQIKELNEKIAGMKSEWNQLPASAKPAATSAIQASVTKLQNQVSKLRALPGVGDQLKPMLDELDTNLSSFSK